MGFFSRLFRKRRRGIFPNGKADFVAGRDAVLAITNHRLSPIQAAQVFTHGAYVLVVGNQKTAERLGESLRTQFPGWLLDEEIEVIFSYLHQWAADQSIDK